tara:strand:- start:92 stop:331 length:240 start_codon:yes stop_codon:yes gene_type:complete
MSDECNVVVELYETCLQETDESGKPYGYGKLVDNHICHIPVKDKDRLLNLVEWASSHKLQFRIHDPELEGYMEVEWPTN